MYHVCKIPRMETRFSHLYQRDSSVSMLRVKMARRRSQSQKENRDRAVNRHRRLDQLPELEVSALDESVIKLPAAASDGMAPGQNQVKSGRSAAVEERKKMLARYKEAKELQKEKARREKEKKGGVFKVGVYKPQPLNVLPQISSAPIRAKTSVPAPSSRVTRSMKQQVQKPPTHRAAVAASRKVDPAEIRAPLSRAVGKPQSAAASARGKAAPAEAAVRPATSRAASRSQTASLAGARKPAPAAANVSKTRAGNKQPAAPPIGRGKPAQGKSTTRAQSRVQKCAQPAEVEEMDTSPADPCSEAEQAQKEEQQEVEEEEEERKTEGENLPAGSSFAPQGFVFQAPCGLKPFPFVPLTPRSADAFLTPSYIGVPPALSFSPMPPRDQVEPPRSSPSPPPPLSPQEPQHNVLYFRSVLASETAQLSSLCEEWHLRPEDSSIPEESRDRIRTAVGQARLLMKERFSQFQGLVDDCELGRGEKVTTCTDLQGFWDMVYFQVEDVIRKFGALREAESRGWQEEHKSPPRPKKTKKPRPAAAAGKAGAGGGASAAARSRLAAVKAAMKAKRAAESAPMETQPDSAPPATQPDPTQTVVFHGGFFRVESPIRVPGASRRSSRRSAVPSLPGSPCPASQFTTPARHRPSVPAHPSPLPSLSLSTPTACTPRPLPQGQCTPPKPALHAGAPCGQSEYDGRQPVAAPAGGQAERTGTLTQPPEALEPSSQSQALERAAKTNSQYRLAPEEAEQTASQLEGVAEPKADGSVLPFPSLQALTPEAVGQNRSLCLSLSPCQTADQLPGEGCGLSFTLSPCQTADQLPGEGCGLSFTLSPCQTADQLPGEGCGLSFTLSPCQTADPASDCGLSLTLSPCPSDGAEQRSPSASSLSLPAPLDPHTPAPCSMDSPAGSSEACVAVSPDAPYAENTPGLDFERYLRPTLRCSPSPQAAAVAMEASPLLATSPCTDVQMDSPGPQLEGQPEGVSLAHAAPAPVQLVPLGHTFSPQAHQLEDGELLLFTSEPRDRVRQSVCEGDLMTFTPPCGR
ncbi:disks large-associated protein 5-like isoform X2 [Anguilla anguilla]|uniref:disks large-associated protein 5-like isoform X2 n=1 Tax=Anguilla anguilla TaxID=7936 RepID=UPI0015AA2C8B|nr:disks large-associated protein 5-like isoform X2 [Anguilla anguilla]